MLKEGIRGSLRDVLALMRGNFLAVTLCHSWAMSWMQIFNPYESVYLARAPNIASEWHITKNGKLTPYDVALGTGKKVWWRCRQGHEWESTIYNRSYGTGCPKCYLKRKRSQ